MSTEEDLHHRMATLENEIKLLKMGNAQPESSKSNVKKPRKPREQTDYNRFMSKYISDQKEKLGSDFNHKVAFGEAAKTWTKNKDKKNKFSICDQDSEEDQ